jgi:hypothetical protein
MTIQNLKCALRSLAAIALNPEIETGSEEKSQI